MPERTKVRIFDDERRFGEQHKERVMQVGLSEDEFDVALILLDEFEEISKSMNERRRQFRNEGRWEHDGENPLDDVSILIVDFDLFETDKYLDAEEVAYLARCFTTCGIVVILNRYGHNRFDLTLKDYLDSFADLDIGQDQLGNLSLWYDQKEDFAPWYWPALPAYAREYEQRVADVERAIREKRSFWNVLDFPDDIRRILPTALVQVLGNDVEDARFDRFVVESDYGLLNKDRERVYGDEGRPSDPETISRIAAARIGKWLEWSVLPEQSILVDAPHLVERLPSLIEGDSEDIKTWNGVAKRHTAEAPNLRMGLIEPFRLKASHWLSKPVWFWPKVVECEDIDDVREPWNTRPPEWRFCEDTSRFCSEDQVVSFKAQTYSPFGYRYVERIDGVEYWPRERFAM